MNVNDKTLKVSDKVTLGRQNVAVSARRASDLVLDLARKGLWAIPAVPDPTQTQEPKVTGILALVYTCAFPYNVHIRGSFHT